MEELTILKQRKPNIAEFLEHWRAQNERRTFDFSTESGKADFFEAWAEMGKHIAHVSTHASLTTVLSVDGVSSVYANVTPAPADGV